jgi:hypothetical protein
MRRLVNADRKQEDNDLKNNVNVLKGHALPAFDTTMQGAGGSMSGLAAIGGRTGLACVAPDSNGRRADSSGLKPVGMTIGPSKRGEITSEEIV